MDRLRAKFEKAKAFKQKKGYEEFFLQISKQHPICVFGGGSLGKQVCAWLLENGIKPRYFCDNRTELHGKTIWDDIRCVSLDMLQRDKEDIYVIVSVGGKAANEAINLQLRDFKHIMRNPLGLSAYWCQTFDIDGAEFVEGVQYVLEHVDDEFSKELFEILVRLRLQDNVLDYPSDTLGRYYSENQYIVKDIVDYDKIKTYVDCGAYIGDSLADFISLGTDARYFCFEMDQSVFEVLSRNAAQYTEKEIHLFPYGVGEIEERASYASDGTGGSKMDASGTEWAEIVSLDRIDFGNKVDFIKMDIEGAEESAIRGAQMRIKKDHPVLAISIYHNFSQFVNVIRMIKDLEPQYRMYIRQHKYTLDDTVCYAIYE